MIVQLPDLTEVLWAHNLPEEVPEAETEFLFFLSGPCGGHRNLPEGMQPVSCMNNWWPSHHGEMRTLTLYWMRPPNGTKDPQPCKRKKWLYDEERRMKYPTSKFNAIKEHLAASGCGFKIGVPPFRVKLFHRFFTLMRMPVEVKPIQKRWLTLHNYRLLDIGAMASYWVNGWKPEEYSEEKELAYFKTTQKEWAEHGMDGYNYNDF